MSQQILEHLTRADSNMGALIRAQGPYELAAELNCQPFEALARAITHQQLHANAARSILQRFVGACGNGSFPSADVVMATPVESLRATGLSFAKIAALKDLAAKTLDGTVPDRDTLLTLSDLEIIGRLTQVRGIGRWTVEMMLMFQLGRPDVLPVDDFGVRNGFRLAYGLRKMPAPKVLAAFGERWAPHRTAAAWYLWRAPELKKAGKLPEPLERITLPRLPRRRRKVRPTRSTSRRSSSRRAAARKPIPATAARRSPTRGATRKAVAAVRRVRRPRARK
ncbi:MAG TPA: hypothetical protein VFO44_03370 [Steroidobacteraceae bacterium]|nr:hypothetical protein [Steroidobacteraceae bacterium]